MQSYTIETTDYNGPGDYTVFISATDDMGSGDSQVLSFVVKGKQVIPPTNQFSSGGTVVNGNGQTPNNGGQAPSVSKTVTKKLGAYFYNLNKVRIYSYKNRLDAHVTLRNMAKKITNLDVNVMLVNRATGNVIRDSGNVRLDLKEVRRETFSFEMPEKGEYLIIVEADDGKINGFTREVRKIKV